MTDITGSRAVYDSVFGFTVAFEAPPEDADQETKDRVAFVFGGVIYTFGGGLRGLRPVAPADGRFNQNRVGLDPVSFADASRADLEAAARLFEFGVPHDHVKDVGPTLILEFRDPDNIALESTAPA